MAGLIEIKVPINLLIVLPLPKVALLCGPLLLALARVHGVEGACCKFLQVSRDDLRSLVHIGHDQDYLTLIAQISQVIDSSLPDTEGVKLEALT